MQVTCGDEAQVGGDFVAGSEQDKIAGDEIRGRDAVHGASAHHVGLHDEASRERLDGALGFGFLQIADPRVQQHDGDNDGGIHRAAHEQLRAARGEQDINERVVKLQEEAHPLAAPFFRGELVQAEALAPSHDLVGIEAALGICVEQSRSFGGWEMVPGGLGDCLHGVDGSRSEMK